MSELMTLGDLAEGKRISDFTGAKASGGGVSILEMELSGERIYWHGSFTPPPIDTSENAVNLGKDKHCFFFTSHFGYALSYIYRVSNIEDLEFFKRFPKMESEIDATGMNLIGTTKTGYLYPLKLEQGTNIYDSHLHSDVHYLFDLIGKDEKMNQIFVEKKVDKMKFCWDLAKTDWFNVENTSKDEYLYGIKREDLLGLIHEHTNGVAFHGISNFEYDKFHSIGIFKDKMPTQLKQAKPLKVVFHKDINKAKIINGRKEIIKNLIEIGY
jgi:hypothetical protein